MIFVWCSFCHFGHFLFTNFYQNWHEHVNLWVEEWILWKPNSEIFHWGVVFPPKNSKNGSVLSIPYDGSSYGCYRPGDVFGWSNPFFLAEDMPRRYLFLLSFPGWYHFGVTVPSSPNSCHIWFPKWYIKVVLFNGIHKITAFTRLQHSPFHWLHCRYCSL